MTRSLDNLTPQVYRYAIEASADPARDKTAREDYLKLVVRLLSSSGQLLLEDADSRSVRFHVAT